MGDVGSELWAWQVLEQPDVWSLVGAMMPNPMEPTQVMHTPLIHRNREVVEKMMAPLARKHAESTGQQLRLARFTLAEVVTT